MVNVKSAKELKALKESAVTELIKAQEVADILIDYTSRNELMKADKGKSKYLNSDHTFKGGFEGCVSYQKESKGLPEKNARKLCAYIGRRAGKI